MRGLYNFILDKSDDKLNKLQISAKKKLKESIKKFEESIIRTQKLINQYYELAEAENKKPKSTIGETFKNLGWGNDKVRIASFKVLHQFDNELNSDDPFHDRKNNYFNNRKYVIQNIKDFEDALKDIITPKKTSIFSPKKALSFE